MAEHARRKVLEAVADALTFPDQQIMIAPVYASPRKPNVPLIRIDWQQEKVEHLKVMGAPLRQQRTLNVVVKLQVQSIADVDAVTDVAAEQLERELQHKSLGGVVSSWRLLGAAKEIDAQGEKPVVQLTYVYEAVYTTQADAPGTIIV